MIAFIDDHCQAYGLSRSAVSCRSLHPIDHEHVAQRQDATRLRAPEDLGLKSEIARVFTENFGVYGAFKM